jgi:hypothetical protein
MRRFQPIRPRAFQVLHNGRAKPKSSAKPVLKTSVVGQANSRSSAAIHDATGNWIAGHLKSGTATRCQGWSIRFLVHQCGQAVTVARGILGRTVAQVARILASISMQHQGQRSMHR